MACPHDKCFSGKIIQLFFASQVTYFHCTSRNQKTQLLLSQFSEFCEGDKELEKICPSPCSADVCSRELCLPHLGSGVVPPLVLPLAQSLSRKPSGWCLLKPPRTLFGCQRAAQGLAVEQTDHLPPSLSRARQRRDEQCQRAANELGQLLLNQPQSIPHTPGQSTGGFWSSEVLSHNFILVNTHNFLTIFFPIVNKIVPK